MASLYSTIFIMLHKLQVFGYIILYDNLRTWFNIKLNICLHAFINTYFTRTDYFDI